VEKSNLDGRKNPREKQGQLGGRHGQMKRGEEGFLRKEEDSRQNTKKQGFSGASKGGERKPIPV